MHGAGARDFGCFTLNVQTPPGARGLCMLCNEMCERPRDPVTSILAIRALGELCHLCLITQAAERRLPVIGACYCFMGVDEKLGEALMKEATAEEVFICLTLR